MTTVSSRANCVSRIQPNEIISRHPMANSVTEAKLLSVHCSAIIIAQALNETS